ncbi:MAG: exopolysaccharide biosynthesis protein [Candidatus Saccharimonadales bacterium]
MKKAAQPQPFSQLLSLWLGSDHPKTIGSLVAISPKKSFGLVFLVLMAVPALPLPTGGITHILEIIVMLLAAELIIGRRSIWLPDRWLQRPVGRSMQRRTIPYLIRRLTWLEGRSRPRAAALMTSRFFQRLSGLIVLALALSAFLAPPFSALDTLPSLGVVIIALGMIVDDFLVWLIGLVIGLAGIGLIIGFGGLIVTAVRHIF